MGYTDVFGGQLLFPSQLSYLQITTAVDISLQWPREQQIEGVDVVADFLDINTTDVALSITFPDARNASTGNKSTVNNIGGNDFTVRDATGGVIQFISSGEQWVLVLTDNSTEAGTWSAFQLGAATTLASASALAGAGLQADGFGLLEQIMDSDVEAATPITVVDGDRAKCLIYTAGAGTCNLPSPGAVGNNWWFMLRNSGSGTLNIVPGAGNIDGSPNINLDPNGSTFIFTDGADFFTVGLTVASTIAFDFVSLAVPGSGDFVLSGANLDRISYRFTGALTGNRRIVVPNTTQQYWADNQTSGAFTLEVSTAAGAGIFIPQGQSVIVYCDATDVINATSSTSVAFPITIGQGGTGATTVGGAQINLQVPPDSRLINTGAGLSGGGDLTGDRTLLLDINSANTTPTPVAGDFFAFEDIDDNLTYKATIQDIIDLAGVTVEDEGAPLATLASVLDFVGAGVVASGAGATKTITIDLVPVSSTFSTLLRGDGAGGWAESTLCTVDGSGTLQAQNVVVEDSGDTITIGITATIGAITGSGLSHIRTNVPWRFEEDWYLQEEGSPGASIGGFGQLWVDNNVQQDLYFVDDTGFTRPIISPVLTFTLDWSDGFSDSNINTYSYIRIGDLVTFWLVTANLGNSNAANMGTGDSIPALIRPDTARYVTGPFVDNASAIVMAQVRINPDGTVEAFAPDSANPPDYGNDWTTSGVKGPVAGATFTYSITD